MQEKDIRECLRNKYITPTLDNKNNYIGVEIEMPIVNLNRQAVDFEIIHKMTESFMQKFSFRVSGIDDEGHVYSCVEDKTGDILSFDCAYSNLELSMGKEKNLFDIDKRFKKYYDYIYNELSQYNYAITGMGINPFREYNNNVPIQNGRYRMLFHHLSTYKRYKIPMYFHAHPEFGTFSSASQVQLDVKYDDIVKNIETFSLLEPIKAILFANSVFPEEDKELLCARDMLWENSTQGINPHNLGMYNRKFNEVEELLSYIETTSIYCVERGNKYINFPPVNIVDYLKSDSVTGEYYEDGQYKSISVTPRIEDLEYLRTFKFEDLTFRGTIEYRSACCQPIKDSMTVAAFHVGIKENLDKVHSLMVEDKVIYHRGYTESELRKMFTYSKYPTLVNEDELYNLVEQVVDMANEGLVSRGYGEEKMLEPLYDRIKKRTNPARNMLKRMAAKEPIESIIIDYGKNN